MLFDCFFFPFFSSPFSFSFWSNKLCKCTKFASKLRSVEISCFETKTNADTNSFKCALRSEIDSWNSTANVTDTICMLSFTHAHLHKFIHSFEYSWCETVQSTPVRCAFFYRFKCDTSIQYTDTTHKLEAVTSIPMSVPTFCIQSLARVRMCASVCFYAILFHGLCIEVASRVLRSVCCNGTTSEKHRLCFALLKCHAYTHSYKQTQVLFCCSMHLHNDHSREEAKVKVKEEEENEKKLFYSEK